MKKEDFELIRKWVVAEIEKVMDTHHINHHTHGESGHDDSDSLFDKLVEKFCDNWVIAHYNPSEKTYLNSNYHMKPLNDPKSLRFNTEGDAYKYMKTHLIDTNLIVINLTCEEK